MRGLLSKFNIIKKIAENRTAVLTAKWRILLYSLPVLALLQPDTTHAASKVGKVLSGAASLGGSAISSIVGAGVEAGATLLVWLFIIVQLSDIVADMFSGIFLFLINFLIGISQYNSFLGSSVVTIGWTVTRDLANMFLVVALLVIAFATILNINSYQASNLLKEFFFAAILVNFSKLICGVLIDASQVVMMTFVSGYSETAAGNFVKMFQVGEWMKLALGTAEAQSQGQSIGYSTATAQAANDLLTVSSGAIGNIAANFFAGIGSNIFVAIIAFIGILAVISLDIILVVRIVTLWFLIVASPLAFVAKVLPVTKGFSSKWWHAFNQQLIAGPVVAFIVWISLASVAVSDEAFKLTKDAQNADKVFAEAGAAATPAISTTAISQWENLALYFVPIVIFFLGAKWAVSVAGGAAKSISGFANKRLSGFARSGLSALRKQAVGKGQFSVVTAGKKGFVGERAPVTSFVGKLGGAVLPSRVNDKFSQAFGGQARARNKAGYKEMKNAMGKLGFGEMGKKREEAEEASNLANYYAAKAKKNRDKEMAEAAKITDPAKRKEAEDYAQGHYLATIKKAQETLDHAGAAQRDIFKSTGLTDDKALLIEMQRKMKDGTATGIELNEAQKIISESFDKKVGAEVAKKRKEYIEDRNRRIAAGESADTIPKWSNDMEVSAKAEAEQQLGDSKTKIADLMKSYKATAPAKGWGITDADAKTPLEHEAAERAKTEKEARDAAAAQVAAQRQDAQRRESTARETLQNTHATIQNTYNSEFSVARTPADRHAATLGLGRNAADSLKNGKQAGAPEADLRVNVMRTLTAVPPQNRGHVVSEMKRKFATEDPTGELAALVDAVSGQLNSIQTNPAQAAAKIEQRYMERPKAPGEGPQFTFKDIGARQEADGRINLPPEAVADLVAAITNDPKLIARLNHDVVAHPEVQRAIGNGIPDLSALMSAMQELNETVSSAQTRRTIADNIGKGLAANDNDDVRRAAGTLRTLV